MTSNRKAKQAAHALAAETGRSYTAARRIDGELSGPGGAEPTPAPTPEPEQPGTGTAIIRRTAEGWRVAVIDDDGRDLAAPLELSGADATSDHVVADHALVAACWVRTEEWPMGVLSNEMTAAVRRTETTAQAAAAREATWRVTETDQPCRCAGDGRGGTCFHGQRCGEDEDGDERCPGHLIHVDRYPGSMWGLTTWWDTYSCDTCRDGGCESAVTLPEIPWGANRQDGETNTTVVWSGVRHPNFPEIPDDAPERPDGDGSCRSCGGYAFDGLLCDGCRADGWTDSYGVVEEPDEFTHECPDCGAFGCGGGHEYDAYVGG